MTPAEDRNRAVAARIGFWCAVAAAISVAASVPALLAVGNRPYVSLADYAAGFQDIELLPYVLWLIPAPFIVAAFACLQSLAPENRRILGQLAAAFTIPYATIVSVNYTIQLTIVRGSIHSGDFSGLAPWVASNPGSVVLATDVLGYFFLGLATLAAFPLFGGTRVEAALRWLFLIHGFMGIGGLVAILAIPFGSTQAQGAAVVALAAWGSVFSTGMFLLGLTFRRTSALLTTKPGVPANH